MGEKFDPLQRVGLYIPGGEVPLVSTVLMTATLARIAGCPQIAAFTPAKAGGAVAPALLAALHLVGVDEVYRLGGVQAVGAMAYGTKAVPAVDKIFGPGNAYVCEAKRQVFGTVGVDSLPGPSEIMIIADRTARADYAAADLLAQAEHGSGREKIYLVATSRRIVAAVAAEIEAPAGGRVRAGDRSGGCSPPASSPCAWSSTLLQAAEVANYVAPEHLELLVKDSAVAGLLRRIATAGAIMVGDQTPTALGDFAAGPSHVLPTGRSGRFLSGLRTDDFLRRTSVIRYDPRQRAPGRAHGRGLRRDGAIAGPRPLGPDPAGLPLRGGTMSELSPLVRPHIAKLHAYTPGLQPSEPGWTKLNTNECPYPPSPRVAEALRREIGPAGESLRLYPNPKSARCGPRSPACTGWGRTRCALATARTTSST